ncbi:hypothetical protein C0J52_09610 [Blattella germanica]|nr:hypothetical protein C0J52_09610 [Blattella germanica]
MHWYWACPVAYKSASGFVKDQQIIKQGAESTIFFSLMMYDFQLPLSFLLFPNNVTFSFHIKSIVDK